MAKSDKNPQRKDRSSTGESSFVSRWSRRKQKVREGGPGEDQVEDNGEDKIDPGKISDQNNPPAPDLPLNRIVADGVSGRMQTRTVADQLAEQRVRAEACDNARTKPLTDSDMPALDTLDENSDFSGFLSSGVSGQLRKQALRKLFSSAGFNVRDGLDDYDEDFTNFEGLGNTVTSDMRHREEVKARKRKEAELAGQDPEQTDSRIVESEQPDSAETADDNEPVDDARQTVDEEQKSVAGAEDNVDETGKPRSGKSS